LLDDGTEYTVSLSTEVDGRTITQVTFAALGGKKEENEDKKENRKKKEEENDKTK